MRDWARLQPIFRAGSLRPPLGVCSRCWSPCEPRRCKSGLSSDFGPSPLEHASPSTVRQLYVVASPARARAVSVAVCTPSRPRLFDRGREVADIPALDLVARPHPLQLDAADKRNRKLDRPYSDERHIYVRSGDDAIEALRWRQTLNDPCRLRYALRPSAASLPLATRYSAFHQFTCRISLRTVCSPILARLKRFLARREATRRERRSAGSRRPWAFYS